MKFGKTIIPIVFWGAVWGIAEATLGNLLHAVNFNIGWLFWFPLAFCFMNRVYRQTGRHESILLLSVIAAAIKLTDLFLPVRLDKVINPAVSILLEGLAVYAAFKVLNGKAFGKRLLEPVIISFSWRILYSAYVLFLPAWMAAISPVRGLEPFLRFLLLEGSVNALSIFLFIKLYVKTGEFIKNRETHPGRLAARFQYPVFFKRICSAPLAAFSLLIAALLCQLVF